jgi:hypothetical protein
LYGRVVRDRLTFNVFTFLPLSLFVLSFFSQMSGPKEGEDILAEEALTFNPSLWIGCQKKYKDVPLHVCNVLTQLRQIPEAVLSLLPSPDVPILDFISLELPHQSAELVMVKIDKCFSPDAPQMDVQAFLRTDQYPQKVSSQS